jgi:hypothetical protein
MLLESCLDEVGDRQKRGKKEGREGNLRQGRRSPDVSIQ